MKFLVIVAFVMMVTGSFILLSITPSQLILEIMNSFGTRKKSFGQTIKEIQNPPKIKGAKAIIMEAKNVLEVTNRESQFTFLCILAVFGSAFGAFVAILVDNLFLLPILAAIMALLPFMYVILSANTYRRQLTTELEVSLSIITSSYERNNNIQKAVEENLTNLNPPIKDVFEWFIHQITNVNPNIPRALEQMKTMLRHDVFNEWIDTMISCQQDRSRKANLKPIVEKLSDMKNIATKLEPIMQGANSSFWIMVALLLVNFPLMYLLAPDMFSFLHSTIPGKAAVALCFVVLVFSLMGYIEINKPVEYKDQ